MPRSFLFLAFNREAWGETILGVRLAQGLCARGDQVRFLALRQSQSLLSGQPFPVHYLDRVAYRYLERSIERLLLRYRPDAIVLADLDQCLFLLQALGLGVEVLSKHGLPVLAIDTWQRTKTGTERDVLGKRTPVGIRDLGLPDGLIPLRPVPILPLANTPGAYANLPAPSSSPAACAPSSGEPVILICTAAWQHRRYPRRDMNRIVAALPRIISQHVQRLGAVQLIHVGPASWSLEESLPGRYRWLGTVSPERFGGLLAEADVLLSLNISATTITRAMGAGLPVVVLWNRRAVTAADVPSQTSTVLRDLLPLPPFAIWPLGWWDFLQPVLNDNAYVKALEPLDLVAEDDVAARLEALLADRVVREQQRARQHAYLERVGALPSGPAAIDAALEATE